MTVMDFYNMLEKEVDSGTKIDADLMISIDGNIHILTGEYYKTNINQIILVGKEKRDT